MKTNENISFNPNDWDGMLNLMSRANEFDYDLSGKNENGEPITISISEDNLSVRTYQRNGWIRKNVFWKDRTTEELFEK